MTHESSLYSKHSGQAVFLMRFKTFALIGFIAGLLHYMTLVSGLDIITKCINSTLIASNHHRGSHGLLHRTFDSCYCLDFQMDCLGVCTEISSSS